MRTFCATLSDCRDSAILLAKDFENLAETQATFITLAYIQLAIGRLARALAEGLQRAGFQSFAKALGRGGYAPLADLH